MGHLRLGTLPKTRPWNKVVRLLDNDPFNSQSIASATIHAAERELDFLKTDPILAYSFWILTRITWFARQDSFVRNLSTLGIDLGDSTSALSFVSVVSDRVRSEAKLYGGATIFREMANLALKHSLTETILVATPSLFGSTTKDIQNACQKYSSKKQFGLLARHFFASYFDRFLRYFVDKEISNHIGPSRSISSLDAERVFTDALKVYTWQSSKIVEDYAGGWYSKHNWESEGDITLQDAKRFTSYGLEKFKMELSVEEGG